VNPNDPIYEELGGNRIRGLVGVGCDPGGAPDAQHLMGSHIRFHNTVNDVNIALWVYLRQLSRFETAYSPKCTDQHLGS
jgi:hypothetical protein